MQARKQGDLEIVLARTFAASRPAVFEALTGARHVRRWMKSTSAGMSLVDCEVDLRAGGSFRYVFQRPNGKKLEVRGAYQSVDAPRGLAYRESYDFSPLQVHVTTVLEDRAGATLFEQTLRYASRPERNADFDGVVTSAREAYESLERYLAPR